LKKLLTRGAWLALFALVIYLGNIAFKEYRYRATMPMDEVVGPNEGAVMAQAVAMALKMINGTRDGLIEKGLHGSEMRPKDELESDDAQNNDPVIYRRDVHIKSHGCVNATFTVPELPETYQWGVLSTPATFDAIVRFSNGDYVIHPDKTRDARGMAVKLLNVPGENCCPSMSRRAPRIL